MVFSLINHRGTFIVLLFLTETCSSMYRAGYDECTKKIYQNIMTMQNLDHSVKCKILSNLGKSQQLDEPKLSSSPPPSPTISEGAIPSPPLKIFDPVTRQYVNSTNTHIFLPTYHRPSPQNGADITPSLPPLIHKAPVSPSSLPPPLTPCHEKQTPVWRPW